jgi:hypothetical protein
MTNEQIAATVNTISDLMQALRDTTTEDKAEIYAGLNLHARPRPAGRRIGGRRRGVRRRRPGPDSARRQFGEVATLVAWALMTAVVGAVAAGAVYVFRWLRHRFRHPELLTRRQGIRAEVVDESAISQAIEVLAERAAVQPPRVYLNVSPDQLAAILRHYTEEE